MLLSRVADALYWISRYLERAENTARVTDVAVDLGLGRATALDGGAIGRLYGSLGFQGNDADEPHPSLADAAFFDVANRNSVIACITAARENARQVREEISSDMWEQLNELYLRLRQIREDGEWTGRTHYLSRSVIEGIHLFQGITDATMAHGEGWQYLQVGRFLERASATAALLDLFLSDDSQPGRSAALDQAEWVGLLRSCSALEAYCRHYTAVVRPERVAEFLLLSAEFPRSVRFAAASLESALLAAARSSGRRAGGRVERLAGRLHASLDYGQVDEILSEDPHAYLAGITRQCSLVHAALQQTYMTYSIESALPA
jgi:uncharacterized alpha-E superfamily protein